jgi:hypothetical protein
VREGEEEYKDVRGFSGEGFGIHDEDKCDDYPCE